MEKIDYSLFKFPKGKSLVKKKKKQKVSKDTYNEVLKACNYKCGLCKAKDILELHHIEYRSEDKNKIDDPKNCIMLCHSEFSKNKCHKKVHDNKKYWQPRLKTIRKRIEKK